MNLRSYLLLLVISLLVLSCNKGKKMPQTVHVLLNDSSTSIHIGTGYDPNYQIPYHYTNNTSEFVQLSGLKDNLTKFLGKNNVEVTCNETEAKYEVVIDQIMLSESFFSDTYRDTCSGWSPQFYTSHNVLLSSVSYWADVTLYNRTTGVAIGSYSTYQWGRERLDSEEGCGSPDFKEIWLGSLRRDGAKELRKKLCNAIYDDMGF